ncbi:MAG: preprotein translocase subunit SecG [Shimia sp.]
MENVLLIILLLLALALIGLVLVQRSEGGGLGLGGGGGGGGGVSARPEANGMTRLTWILGFAFMAAALVLTLIAARDAGGISVVDQLGIESNRADPEAILPAGEDLLPPGQDDGPLIPQAD